jgi:putative flippase GtrA
MIDRIKELARKYEKFIKFCLVGGMNTLLSILIYNALLLVHVHFNIANLIAFLLTWLNAFYWNGKHVFRGTTGKAMLRYFVLYVGTFLLGSGLLYLLVKQLGVNETLAQLPCLVVTTLLNYTGSKYWAFKK